MTAAFSLIRPQRLDDPHQRPRIENARDPRFVRALDPIESTSAASYDPGPGVCLPSFDTMSTPRLAVRVPNDGDEGLRDAACLPKLDVVEYSPGPGASDLVDQPRFDVPKRVPGGESILDRA